MAMRDCFRRFVAAGLGLVASASVAAAAEVNVYTAREPGLFAPIAQAFTARTGIKVNTIFVKDGLAERVAAEGAASPADLLVTVEGAITAPCARGAKAARRACSSASTAARRRPLSSELGKTIGSNWPSDHTTSA